MEVACDEQYAALKFCFRLNKTSAEAYEMLQEAYGEFVLPYSTARRWFKMFKDGRKSISKEGGPGAPVIALTEENINTAAVIVREDRRITLRTLSEIMNISLGATHMLVTEKLHMRRVCARWVPRLLIPEQKDTRVQVCMQLKMMLQEDPEFLSKVITADESWLHHFDPESKQQSSVWKSPGSPTPKKAKVVSSAGKVMVISFFDIHGMVYQHVVPAHTTVTGAYYRDVLKILQGHIRRKRPHLHETSWMLHHDNARPHIANVVAEYLAKINVKCVPHPPYSPDLAPGDFFLFPNLKKKLRGRHFPSSEAVVKGAEAILKTLSKNGFQHVFADWQKRWDKCIAFNGDYFEKDHQRYEDE